MKQILKLIVAFLFMAIAVNSYAAKNEDITLIVTSDGTTKDEAIKNALRNAIEQTYGVFVSANTDILNDEVVSDEIATVASGNIKSYKELSTSQSDDRTTVTLEAVVSVGKLISYAKSKGAECEIDGAALYADIELQNLYKANEEKAVENIINTLDLNFKDGFDYDMKVSRCKQREQDILCSFYKEITKDYATECPSVFEIVTEIKLNHKGEKIWQNFIESLKCIGNFRGKGGTFHYNSEITNSDGFPYHATVPLGEECYIQNYRDVRALHFNFRSPKSVKLLFDLQKKLKDKISNIYISTNEGAVLEPYNVIQQGYISLQPGSRIEAVDEFQSKVNKTWWRYVAVVFISNGEIKQLSKLIVKHNVSKTSANEDD